MRRFVRPDVLQDPQAHFRGTAETFSDRTLLRSFH